MTARRSFRYRLCPTRTQVALMQGTLDRCRELYNAGLEERRTAYRRAGVTLHYADQSAQLPAIKEARPEYAAIGSQVLQDVLERLERAYRSFFRRVKAGQVAGYPRFKGRDRYDSFTFKQAGWKLTDGRLRLQGIGALKVRWSREIAGTVKTVTIRRDGEQWHVCFSCELETPDPAPGDRPAVGIDVGLEAFATLSTGERIENPRFFRKGEAVLVQRQQALSRKQRGSNRRQKAKRLVQSAHRKVRAQRLDFHHKQAGALVARFGRIAVEDLRVANMVRNHALAKSISDAGWAQFVGVLSSKAEWAGTPVIAVNPAGTSQTCPECGQIKVKTLGERWHSCDCGCSLQRDHAAALIILARAGQARRAGARESPAL